MGTDVGLVFAVAEEERAPACVCAVLGAELDLAGGTLLGFTAETLVGRALLLDFSRAAVRGSRDSPLVEDLVCPDVDFDAVVTVVGVFDAPADFAEACFCTCLLESDDLRGSDADL